ncbi:MAG: hypothetical protein WC025_04005 [Candidatus Magasanikbacteria bacterium]
MEQVTISWGLVFWQVLNLVVFVGVIFLVVRLIRNSNKTVASLDDVGKKLNDLSKKIDQISEK